MTDCQLQLAIHLLYLAIRVRHRAIFAISVAIDVRQSAIQAPQPDYSQSGRRQPGYRQLNHRRSAQ
jgi:hypothetical protein